VNIQATFSILNLQMRPQKALKFFSTTKLFAMINECKHFGPSSASMKLLKCFQFFSLRALQMNGIRRKIAAKGSFWQKTFSLILY
jgi:hypothetical protein